MNNKIKFLRGTSNEYTAAEKDNDTIYFTTDDGKLYIGDKEVSGESIKALNSHINDNVKHIINTERANWNAAKTHADSTHAPSNAQANVIETIKVNGTALTPSSKVVDIIVPSVGNGTITIKQAGTTKGTFTTNQSGNTTIALDDNNTVYTHPTSDGNKHVPANGTSNGGKYLKATATAGSYEWGNLTKSDVTTALGYTPPTTNTTYSVATSSTLGLVKSGTDITVDSSGNVSVNDDSHNHVISNVDGLQSALDGKAASSHTHSAYVNQNAFSNVVVGSTTVSADNATDTLILVAGSNITITPDATNDKITIAATDTKYTHPTYTAKDSGLYKITVDGTGHVSAATAVTKADITALGISASDKYHIEYGTTSVTSSPSGTTVYFSTSFRTTPTLVVGVNVGPSNVNNKVAYGVANTTSATLHVKSSTSSTSGTVSWIAIGGM